MKYVSATLEGFWKSLHDGHYDGTPQLGVVATEFQKLIKDLTLRFTKSPGGGQRYLDELSEGQTSLLYFALAATYQTLMWDMQAATGAAIPCSSGSEANFGNTGRSSEAHGWGCWWHGWSQWPAPIPSC